VVVSSLSWVGDHVWRAGNSHASVWVDDGDGVASPLSGCLRFRLMRIAADRCTKRGVGREGVGGRGGRRLNLML
jgi:hypothetical protein